MRGYHGIGGRKPQPASSATGNADDLDDMLDGFGGMGAGGPLDGNDPLAVIN